MRASKSRIEIAMARSCMNLDDLAKTADMPRPTVNNVISGKSVRPGTLGKIARALGVDVTEIMEGVSA